MEMTKILFIHNTLMWYRIPFFKRLDEIYDVKFIFTHLRIYRDIYGVESSNSIGELENLKCKVFKNSFVGIKFELIRELFKNDYDIIVDSFLSLEGVISYIIARFRRKPIIFWSEAWDWKRRKTLKEKLFSPIFNYIVSHSDAFLVPGVRHKNYFISLGVSYDKVFIMPNASNIFSKNDDCLDGKILKTLDINDKKVVLFVGRLVKQKGIEYLIQAFSKLRMERNDVVLVIVGTGEYRNDLEMLTRILNISDSVYFIGYIENERLPPYYRICNVCIMPSITYNQADAWGFIINEAMYFGKPIIATDAVGAAFDMIKDGDNGFVVQEKNIDALYHSMKKILSDSELEKKMGLRSKIIIEEGFRYENMIDGFNKAINYVRYRELEHSKVIIQKTFF